MRFSGNHTRGARGMMGRSSARGQGGRCLSGRCMVFQWAMGLDMAREGLETSGAFVKMAVDMDVTEPPTLEASFMIAGMITSKGYVMVTASPPDFGVSEGDLFLVRREDEAEGVEFFEATAASSMRCWVEASSFRYLSRSAIKSVMPN